PDAQAPRRRTASLVAGELIARPGESFSETSPHFLELVPGDARSARLQLAPRRSPPRRAADRADSPARGPTGVEQIPLVGLEATHRYPCGHGQPGEHLARLGIDAANVGLRSLPGPVPELAVHPRDAGDEAVRLDGAQDGACLRIDLVD